MNSPLEAWTRALEKTAPIERHRSGTFPRVIDELAEHLASKPALVARARRLDYRALAELTHRYARWGLDQGLKPGDVVALLLPNCPEYLAIWIGLTRIGVVVALLNTQLRAEALAHSIRIVAPQHIIVGTSLTSALESVRPHLSDAVQCWFLQDEPESKLCGADVSSIESALERVAGTPLTEAEAPWPELEHRALYIYTSGTTGLPKAAVISHYRIMQWTHWFAGMMDLGPKDRMYNCLPMYHSIGGVVAAAAPLVGGGTVIVRERFSAREFWPDVAAERCTLFQYIGELCRYLLASPPHPEERRHALRLACGNGLRREIWEPFQRRFQIPHILEYYASTEGSFSLYNCEGKPGAIGRIPPFLSHRLPVAIVQYDPDTTAPVRDENGRCLRCGPDEMGEAIGEVLDADGQKRSRFEGYADATASNQKILHDVFAPGDAWYRTGDLMRRDARGFFYFVDRIGETFRWKGENVSTSEVAAVIGACPGVNDAVVYGVAVPGTEGRAGMAAIAVAEGFELAELRSFLASRLPDYARPLFVRIVPEIESTGTFKLRKQELAAQGYESAPLRDRLYFDDRARQAYVELDASLRERLHRGDLRL